MKNFETVPNQKVVCVHREKLNDCFLGINKETFLAAYKALNATALALYLYFASNKDGYTFALSPKAIQADLGMPQSTCQDQIKKLIEKGYLVSRKENSNIYDFHEHPKQQKTELPENKPKKREPSGLEDWKAVF